MNVVDRVEAAKHTLTGSGLAKAVSKATSHEIIGPKKKHVDYIQHALETDNVSIPDTADMLFERCTNSSWVVVFKSLVSFHHLMSYANERFMQYVASRSTTWMLHNFYDKNGVQGYDMSHAIRRYSAYLAEKAYSYRTMGYDFCRAARGKDNGVLRNMDSTKEKGAFQDVNVKFQLLKALPVIQGQVDALIATEINSNDLTNGVVTAAFMALFKEKSAIQGPDVKVQDLIRLFACYNDGIINLLEIYFELKKNDCKVALEVYKKFLARMERVSEFLKAAEDAGVNKGDIPDLTKAPNSLLAALEEHYQSLEKGKTTSPPTRQISIPAFDVSQSQSSTYSITSPEEDSYLKEQQKMLEMFENKKKEEETRQMSTKQSIPQALSPPTNQHVTPALTPPKNQTTNLFASDTSFQSQPQQPQTASGKLSDDLLLLSAGSSAFTMNQQNTAFSGNYSTQSYGSSGFGTNGNLDFNSAFQNNQSKSTPNLMDDVLQPERQGGSNTNVNNNVSGNRLTGDLNQGLERVAMSLDGLNINPGTLKANTTRGHSWKAEQPSIKTGGANYQMSVSTRSTLPQTSMNYSGMTSPTMGMNPGMQPAYQQPAMQPMMQPQMGMRMGMNMNNMNNMGMMQQPGMNPYMQQNAMYGNPMMSAQPGFYRPPQMGYGQPMANTSMMNNDPFK